jgi:hypothetical protein
MTRHRIIVYEEKKKLPGIENLVITPVKRTDPIMTHAIQEHLVDALCRLGLDLDGVQSSNECQWMTRRAPGVGMKWLHVVIQYESRGIMSDSEYIISSP